MTDEEIKALVAGYCRVHANISSLWGKHQSLGLVTYRVTDDPCDDWPVEAFRSPRLTRIVYRPVLTKIPRVRCNPRPWLTP